MLPVQIDFHNDTILSCQYCIFLVSLHLFFAIYLFVVDVILLSPCNDIGTPANETLNFLDFCCFHLFSVLQSKNYILVYFIFFQF